MNLYILMQYFGGSDYELNSIFDFFYPNNGMNDPGHADLSPAQGRECIN